MKSEGLAPPAYVRDAGGGEWRIRVWVQPGAKRNEITGVHDQCLRIRLSAPAVDNKANTALVEYVAELLGLRRNQVSLEAGHTSRRKTLRVQAQAEPNWPGTPPEVSPGGQPPTEGDSHGSTGPRHH